MSLRKIYYTLPPSMRYLARKLYYLPTDLYDSATGKRNKGIPPKGDIFIGPGDFEKEGDRQLELLQKHIFLQQTDCVLDVGCGIGRTALPLSQYLNKEGKYEGFDVVEKGIKWCNNKIKKDYPNFNFKYVPLKNDLYNTSEGKASDFVFPYKEDTFDKSFLFSVFTHMQLEEIENYLKEIERVLKPGGYCLATFFIYDQKIETEIADRRDFAFPVKKEGYRLMSEKVKGANVAISEKRFNEMLDKTNLTKVSLIGGFWRDDKNAPGRYFQDIVVLKK